MTNIEDILIRIPDETKELLDWPVAHLEEFYNHIQIEQFIGAAALMQWDVYDAVIYWEMATCSDFLKYQATDTVQHYLEDYLLSREIDGYNRLQDNRGID